MPRMPLMNMDFEEPDIDAEDVKSALMEDVELSAQRLIFDEALLMKGSMFCFDMVLRKAGILKVGML